MLDSNHYACKCFSRSTLSQIVQVGSAFIHKSVFIKKEIDVTSVLYNENLVNGVEVIDDPNHDQL